ncbi:MAG: LiaI-LiaF-like domain-containing protein [Thermoanaerobaculia bacterium]
MNGTDASQPPPRLTGRLVAGLIILGLGVLFLLDNLEIIDAGRLRDWWPALLIGIGVSHLLSRDSGRRGWGMVFVAAGGFFLLRNFHIVQWRWREVWPFLLVLLGASLVWRSLRRPTIGPDKTGLKRDVNEFAILGGGERIVRSREFRGGDVTAIMGGFMVDLREAELAAEGARIEVFVMMGGLEFKVPESWDVVLNATPIMGSSEHKARSGGVPGTPVRTLTISGLVLMGGIEVKN